MHEQTAERGAVSARVEAHVNGAMQKLRKAVEEVHEAVPLASHARPQVVLQPEGKMVKM